ncbi:MAG: hypothetical protein WCE48_06170 [Steroidobacteraceae bacterium]
MRLLVAVILIAAQGAQAADAPAPVISATRWLLDGQPIAELRLRDESVSDDAFARTADALTLRTRLGWKTASWNGWSALLEGEDLRSLTDHYNSTRNGRTTYPVVSDPEGAELNRASISYATKTFEATVGRQRIQRDNERHFGASGWRQREQTFDAVGFSCSPDERTKLRYSWVDGVRRVNGTRVDLDAHLLNASRKLPVGEGVAYAYLIRNQDTPTASTRTLGARWLGDRAIAKTVKFSWALEYADQHPYQGGAAVNSADYWFAEAALSSRGHTLKAGSERLGGSGQFGFTTPYATLHAFDGWDDKFLTTPRDGLRDWYIAVNGPLARTKYVLAVHRFEADHGSAHYGNELDASVSLPFARHYTALAKWARYDADRFAADTNKLWISIEARL